MIEHTITGLMLVVAVIHVIPITGFFGASRLEALYGIPIETGELEILMRHRGVIFGILGVFFGYAAFVPALQPIAFIGAAVSLTTFFLLAFSVPHRGKGIRKIVIGDVVAAVCLVGAVALYAAYQ